MDFTNTHDLNLNYKYPYAVSPLNRSDNLEDTNKYRLSPLDEAINEIKKAITSEQDDAVFYSVLLSQAPTKQDKTIIESIINDEKKHKKMLRELYEQLTKMNSPQSMMSRTNSSSTSYMENLEKALFDELKAVEKYRKIMAAMPDKEKYAKIMEILTDEIKHAIKYNFLITKNSK